MLVEYAMLRCAVVVVGLLGLLAPGCKDGGGGGDDTDSGDSGTGCGEIGFYGECDGTTLRYCACDDPSDDEACRATGELQEVDCADSFASNGDAVCLLVDEVYGYDCGMSTGESCDAPEGGFLFCDGTDAGCVVTPDEHVCATDVGTCDDGDFTPHCEGDALYVVCNLVQPVTVDCDAYGGTCDTTGLVCAGLGADSPCGPTENTVWECGEGFECTGATATETGTCTSSGG